MSVSMASMSAAASVAPPSIGDDPIEIINIVDELLGIIKIYEMICDKILKKGSLSVRDEMEYNAAVKMIEQCEKELDELGYYEGEY